MLLILKMFHVEQSYIYFITTFHVEQSFKLSLICFTWNKRKSHMIM